MWIDTFQNRFQFSTAIYQVPYMALTMHLSHVPAEVESATAWRAVAESLSMWALSVKLFERGSFQKGETMREWRLEHLEWPKLKQHVLYFDR